MSTNFFIVGLGWLLVAALLSYRHYINAQVNGLGYVRKYIKYGWPGAILLLLSVFIGN